MEPQLSGEVEELIAAEERLLEQVLTSLKAQQRRGGARLHSESGRARALTAEMVASHRDEDKQLLASDEAVAHGVTRLTKDELNTVEKLIEKPYFARMVVEEEDDRGRKRQIEYKLGNAANIECRIIDWKRAPISKLYYEYREGDEYGELIQGRERVGKVLLRHRVEIVNGELVGVNCHFGDFVKSEGTWKQGSSSRSGKGRRYGELPDVLSLITPEQFRAITEEARGTALIQGVAGSGKTTVALYRLAWLFSQPEVAVFPARSRFIVRSPVLRQYIERSREAVGLGQVPALLYREFVAKNIEQIVGCPMEVRPGSEETPVLTLRRAKHSMATLAVLEDYALEQKRRLLDYLSNQVPWGELPGEARGVFERLSRDEARSRHGLPPFVWLDEVVQTLRRLLVSAPASSAVAQEVINELERIKRRMSLYQEDLVAILRRFEQILAQDETKLLDRDLLQRSLELTQKCLADGVVHPLDAPLLLRLYQFKQGEVFIPEGHSIRRGLIDHLVVDEVQDFSPVELATLIGSASSIEQLTLVGDTAQQIGHEAVFPGWEILRKRWQLGDELANFVSLMVSYRSTKQIMQFAFRVRGESADGVPGRDGPKPKWFRSRSEDGGVRTAISAISELQDSFGSGVIVVATRTLEEARYVVSLLSPSFSSAVRVGDDDTFSFDDGILVTDVSRLKGLEFPAVLLWNPTDRGYPDTEQARNLLYVAATRAEEQLCLVNWSRPSPHIEHVGRRYLQMIIEERQIEDDNSGLPPWWDSSSL